MTHPQVPAYGTSTLADLLPSMSAVLGLPGRPNVLHLPEAERFVVLLVDGLGWHLLEGREAQAPFLCELRATGRPITSGVPSTTATSITSLGTGLTPGQHGIAGYTFRFGDHLLNALLWQGGLDGLDVQPQLTMFERLTKLGVYCATVTPARFRNTGLTTCALRGAHFFGFAEDSTAAGRVEYAVRAATAAQQSLVYVYNRELDHAGHKCGTASPEWTAELTRVDALASALRAALPEDVRLIVTGDHGMVDVPEASRLTIERYPELVADVRLIGGEGRLRQLYVRPGTEAAVRARWAEHLGDRACVMSRDEAFAAAWFGPVQPKLADRFGDVLVAMADDGALMTTTQPNEFGLVGMHGSLTAAELTVPLLIG
ncbi:alkaline phosphatase family protein [Micropruina sp.]|uniref:alkaline phosphatase family protein n=1 Tax=Micropruina sp. TaxID=2737536 RepID=UPI0039E2320F